MSRAVAKLSVRVPHDLARAVRRRAGSRGLSEFVARAMANELERESLGAFLGELDAKVGVVPRKDLSAVRREWPKG